MSLWLVSVELDKCVEYLTVDEAFLLESLQSSPEVDNHTSISDIFVIFLPLILDEATAEKIVGDPEDRTE